MYMYRRYRVIKSEAVQAGRVRACASVHGRVREVYIGIYGGREETGHFCSQGIGVVVGSWRCPGRRKKNPSPTSDGTVSDDDRHRT